MTTDAPVHDETVLDAEGNKILSGLRDIELDPHAIDYLCNANPMMLTKPQRAVIIEMIRRHRGERIAVKARKAEKRKLTADEKNKLTLDDLGDLGFDVG